MGGKPSKPKPICSEGGGKCKGDKFTSWPQHWGAKFVADPGQSVTIVDGDGTRVYYGGALSWRSILLFPGQSIECSASGWKKNSNQKCGCNPAPTLKKWCFAGPRWGEDTDAVDKYWRQKSQSAHSDYIGLDVEPGLDATSGLIVTSGSTTAPPATDAALFDTSSVDMEMLLPLVLCLLLVVNCVVFLYLCIRRCTRWCTRCTGKGKQYQVVQYQSESEMEQRVFVEADDDSEK